MALAPKHLPDELGFLDILDEITFSKLDPHGFKLEAVCHSPEESS